MTTGTGTTADLGVLRAERLRLVERLRGLPEEEWARPSLCAGWTVHHVVAHLTTPFLASVPQVFSVMARSRGISPAMDAVARRLQEQHAPEELLDVLERNAASRFRPPGLPLSAALTDAVCHGADVRWALGDPVADWAAPARLAPVLEFLTGPRALLGFRPPGRLRGVALVPDDLDRRWGRGAEARGPAVALASAVLGRREALQVLSGEGVARLAA